MASQQELMSAGIPWLAAQMIGQDLSNTLTATGTTQLNALQIVSDMNIFTTVAAGTGAVLPSANTQALTMVWNGGANALLVYAAVGETMNVTLNGSVSIPVNKSAIFMPNLNRWIANISA